MHKEKAEDAPNVMTGTFCTQIQPVDILFDSNVMHSFISAKLVETLRLVLTRKSSLLSVILPDGNVVRCEELYEDCPIRIYEHEFLANLYRFKSTDFEVILGMNWLAKY